MRLFRIAALATSILWLSGCADPSSHIPSPRGDTPPEVERPSAPYRNQFGQTVEAVDARTFASWLLSHDDCEIVSIAAVSDTYSTQFNRTTHFWVVYRRQARK